MRRKSFNIPEHMSAEEFAQIRRQELDLSQAELAELIGIRSLSVYRYECGSRNISHMLALLMRLLASVRGTLFGQKLGL